MTKAPAASIRFTATIHIRGVNPYVLVSTQRAERLKPGWRKPLPVLLRIGAEPKTPWRTNLMPSGDGSFYLYLHGQIRRACKTGVGDRVAVELSFDSEYRNGPQHPMPAAFRAALARNTLAKANWKALPPSRQKEVLRYLAGLKSAEARSRNLTRALSVLSGNVERFMARTWRNGA